MVDTLNPQPAGLRLWFINIKRRPVWTSIALHGAVFDRYERPGNEREGLTAKIQA